MSANTTVINWVIPARIKSACKVRSFCVRRPAQIALMLLEYLGVHIEDTKQIADEYGIFSKTVYYFSVPETSTIELAPTNYEINAKIKYADGLISLAKEEILDMLLDACKIEFGDDEEFIQEIKDNSSDYFKFYAKVRNGEVWNKELGDAAIKKLSSDIKLASSYKEV